MDRSGHTHILFDFFGTLVEYSPSRRSDRDDREFAMTDVSAAFITTALRRPATRRSTPRR